MASGMIQTIGMFHKDPEQRAKSNVYHGMIVMVRQLVLCSEQFILTGNIDASDERLRREDSGLESPGDRL